MNSDWSVSQYSLVRGRVGSGGGDGGVHCINLIRRRWDVLARRQQELNITVLVENKWTSLIITLVSEFFLN